MLNGCRCRPLVWLCLWFWVVGPVASSVVVAHGHESVDPCWLPSVVHDASQHRVESGQLAPLDLDHCHACDVPRASMSAVGTTLPAPAARTMARVPLRVACESYASISLPGRSPPAAQL